ncbi:MAG TPA: alkaline phosphatase family protein, partial [Vicinamibacterales bacterium]|nr:alkaline phosphatase family protein [Vicinamibacterales bacterium]
AYDTTDDATPNYDTLRVEMDSAELPRNSDGWFAVQRLVAGGLYDGLYGSWSKVLHHDASLRSVTLYWGAVSRSEVYPDTFRLTVEARAGFWPGLPDENSVRDRLRGGEGLSTADFMVQVKRLSDYLTRAALAAIETMPFDLLLAYQPAIDQTEHQFLMTLPTQLHATPGNRAEAAEARAVAFRMFDGAVAAVTSSIDVERDALVVTGDHGVAPVELEVRVNAVLAEQGYAKSEGGSLADDTRWAAYATGQVAHLYRFHDPDDSDAVVKLLTDLRTSDGAPVFEQAVKRGNRLHPHHPDHPHTGDIVAYAWPRFALSTALGERFARPLYYGQHGALNTHRELDTILAAGGAGVAAGRIPQLRQTAVAPYIAALLGIEPPRDAE